LNELAKQPEGVKKMKCSLNVFALMMALFSAFHSASSAKFSLKTINVSVPAVSLLQAPLFIAIDAGAFKKYGTDVCYIVTGRARFRHWLAAPSTSPRLAD
jgi:ABC-type nitrate/sulfonate/bicarbonate transport system substrate-binding protein